MAARCSRPWVRMARDHLLLCFCTNTRIMTPSGERPVQTSIGDLVTTHRGEARPIVWIGNGKVLATRRAARRRGDRAQGRAGGQRAEP